ncbi:hypothetical protein CANCADRAFT_56839 [Tortispora caseinolytica NRRL Y-17796]|uniref:Cns1/TTC4 wheel domain-containing protein n=1 Tax=Tortispora caseinolytica NRRL Y-17796 TaxID=767744 RepID=A0A1E4TEU5_9ASCO|nr:hypothetical protein CANCADRAFT_56839 [Tortispora caseinolytica NRRL Y-17796]
MPLFMTELDESDGEGGENIPLEAMKALQFDDDSDAYENAQSFKDQGNESFKFKDYSNAIALYDNALKIKAQIAEGKRTTTEPLGKQMALWLSCYLNKSACNFELKNYRRCINDAKQALQIDPRNLKAHYRASKAFLALDKTDECFELLRHGLEIDSHNLALQSVLKQLASRREYLDKVEAASREREEKRKLNAAALLQAKKHYKLLFQKSLGSSDSMPAGDIALLDQNNDPATAFTEDTSLYFPVVILYPLVLQSDYIESWEQSITPAEQLEQLFSQPAPWDEHNEYTKSSVELFADTPSAGLLKVGKNIPLIKILENGKVPLLDGIVRLYVTPKRRSSEFIAKHKESVEERTKSRITVNL